MKKNIIGIVVLVSSIFTFEAFSNENLDTAVITKSVDCSDESTGQVCDKSAQFDFCGLGKVQYKLKVSTPGNHCSKVSYAVTVNGRDFGQSVWLGKDQHYVIDDIGYPYSGSYDIKVSATGKNGGCNSGRLGAWKAILTIFR